MAAQTEIVADSGTGTFTQTGGTNTIFGAGGLSLAANSGGAVGNYGLSAGQLFAPVESVGVCGAGTFTQSGGTNTAGSLNFGYFPGSGGTYTLNGGILITSGISSGSGAAAFNFGGGTLQASGNLSTTLPMTLTGSGGNATVDPAGYIVTLSGSLSGPGGLTVTESGTLVLAGANTYTGDTTISGGMLQLNDAPAAQYSTVNVNVDNGLAFGPGVTAPVLGGLAGTGAVNLGTTDSPPLPVVLTVGGNNANTTYSGTLSGSGGLTKAGTGTMTLAAANTYNGDTTIIGGTLQLNNAQAVQNSTVNVSVDNGLAFGPRVTAPVLGGLAGSGMVNLATTDSPPLPVVLTVGGNNANTTYSGTLSGSGGLTKAGTGTMTLAAANTYNGDTTISGGTLQLNNALAVQYSTVNVNLDNGLAFGPGVTAPVLGGLAGTGMVILATADSPPLPVVLTAGGNSADTTYSGTLSGSGGLTKAGTGTLILAAANAYSGDTTVSGGMLQLNSAQAVQNSTVNVNVNNGLAFGPGVTAPVLGGLAGTGAVNLATTDSPSLPVLLTAGGNNANTTYSGTLSGSGGLTKTGSGALTLTGSNTYTGGTTVELGILVVSNGSNGSATGSGSVLLSGGTLASGAGGGSIADDVEVGSLPAEIAPGGIDSIGELTVGSLITASNLTLDFDLTTPGGSSDLLVVTGGLTLVPGTAITFGRDPLTPGDFRLIEYGSLTGDLGDLVLPTPPWNFTYSLSTMVDAGYIDLVSVPEPSTFVLLGVAAAGLLGFAWRRKRGAALRKG